MGGRPDAEQLQEMSDFVAGLRQNIEAILIRHFPDWAKSRCRSCLRRLLRGISYPSLKIGVEFLSSPIWICHAFRMLLKLKLAGDADEGGRDETWLGSNLMAWDVPRRPFECILNDCRGIAVGQAQGQIFALKLAEKLARRACALAKANFGPEKRTENMRNGCETNVRSRFLGVFGRRNLLLGSSQRSGTVYVAEVAPSGFTWNNGKECGRCLLNYTYTWSRDQGSRSPTTVWSP